jgi:hypothetical protein
MFSTLTLISALIALSSANPFVKRGLGYKESGCPMTYYGSDGEPQPFAPYGVGHCAQEPVDKKYYAALNSKAFPGNCGLCAKITRGDACVVVPIVDSCPTCAGSGQSGIDVSLQAFSDLVGGESQARHLGIVSVSWEVVTCPNSRKSTGSKETTDTDPCSGSSGQSTQTEDKKEEKPTTTTAPQATSSSVAITDKSESGLCGATGKLYGFPCCKKPELVDDKWVDKNGYKWGSEDGASCIVPKSVVTTGSKSASQGVDSSKIACDAEGKLWGFPCCKKPEEVDNSYVDKNGYPWGSENGVSCIVPRVVA